MVLPTGGNLVHSGIEGGYPVGSRATALRSCPAWSGDRDTPRSANGARAGRRVTPVPRVESSLRVRDRSQIQPELTATQSNSSTSVVILRLPANDGLQLRTTRSASEPTRTRRSDRNRTDSAGVPIPASAARPMSRRISSWSSADGRPQPGSYSKTSRTLRAPNRSSSTSRWSAVTSAGCSTPQVRLIQSSSLRSCTR